MHHASSPHVAAPPARIGPRRWTLLFAACAMWTFVSVCEAAEARQPPAEMAKAITANACAGCRVVVREIGLLSDETFDTDLSNVRVMRLSSGQFLIGGRKGVLGVFDSTLRFRRQLGRSGAGPGEFRSPTLAFPKAGDSVAIFDWALRRLSIYGAELGAPSRSLVLPEFRDALLLSSGELLLTGLIATPSAAGFPLHLVSSTGAIKRSFGTAAPRVHKNSDRVLGKSVVRSPTGEILVGSPFRYEIQVWSEDLRLTRTFRREVAWFPPTAETYSMSSPGRARPSTVLVALGVDTRQKTVLATFHTAASGWREDPKLKGTREERWPSDPNEAVGIYLNRYFDTMVDVIDPLTMNVLASKRLSGMYIPVSKSPFFVTLQEASDGTLSLRVIRLDVVDRDGALLPSRN